MMRSYVILILHLGLILCDGEDIELAGPKWNRILWLQNIKAIENGTDDDGNKIFSGTIVGGTKVINGETRYPWFARGTIYEHAYGRCGAILVSPEYVLTAAHCVRPAWFEDADPGYQVGSLCYDDDDNCGQKLEERYATEIFKHPDYKRRTNENDIALVRLNEPVTSINPVEMDQGQYSPNYSTGKSLWVVGFGDTEFEGEPSDDLMHVRLNYVPQGKCQSKFENADKLITEDMMCTFRRGKDACHGDSGGPLFDKSNNVVVGIVSWGIGCAHPDYPGVFSRISEQWNWIKETICENSKNDLLPRFCGDVTDPPTSNPTKSSTSRPTSEPTAEPSVSPTTSPSLSLTSQPTKVVEVPSSMPSYGPTKAPIKNRTQPPNTRSKSPSVAPIGLSSPVTNEPTSHSPSVTPTEKASDDDMEDAMDDDISFSDDDISFSDDDISFSDDDPTTNTPSVKPIGLASPVTNEPMTHHPSETPSRAPSETPSEEPTEAPSETPSHLTSSPTKGPTAFPTAAPSPAPSPSPKCQAGEEVFLLKLKTDNDGRNIAWRLKMKRNGNYKSTIRKRIGLENQKLYYDELCLPINKCFRFIIRDRKRDGLCCNKGRGFYRLFLKGKRYFYSRYRSDRKQEVVTFGTNGRVC